MERRNEFITQSQKGNYYQHDIIIMFSGFLIFSRSHTATGGRRRSLQSCQEVACLTKGEKKEDEVGCVSPSRKGTRNIIPDIDFQFAQLLSGLHLFARRSAIRKLKHLLVWWEFIPQHYALIIQAKREGPVKEQEQKRWSTKTLQVSIYPSSSFVLKWNNNKERTLGGFPGLAKATCSKQSLIKSL